MMTLGAHEVAIIIVTWLLIVFGPVLAKLGIALSRRFVRRAGGRRQRPADTHKS